MFIKKIIGMHSKTCPEIVIDLNNKLMVQFAWQRLGKSSDAEVDEDVARQNDLIKDLFVNAT